ncbi:anti-sigma factor family protein [Streptomyces sp. SP18CS02]|uniref:anti-sigma factor family protein n=1 Tax=Streptomyces sp. SP18CS02 TaxID=3002531 RepID=UPI002E75FBF7|nr:zf-HC2 domain-containing protein [Streptomyces sp. SP18CS02]MEE1754358.1 zf-HC2 domain-containing protein [Streptomyces sp. SP18CS02]
MTSTTDTTQHPDVSEISELAEGLLSPSRAADVRSHLEGCPLCADVRTSLEEIRGLLGTLPGPARMPADIAGRIDAALAAEALLNASAPVPAEHVSRETVPASAAAHPAHPEPVHADRPAGRPRAATGPGRSRPTRHRRRNAVLGAVFGAAAVGVSVLLMQTTQPSGQALKGAADAPASSSGMAAFSGTSVQSHVKTLLAAGATPRSPRTEKGPLEAQTSPHTPKLSESVQVPPCVQEGTGRSEPPLAAEMGEYEGRKAYLVVLPHPTDARQVEAYVVDASCVTSAKAAKGDVLLTHPYPRP